MEARAATSSILLLLLVIILFAVDITTGRLPTPPTNSSPAAAPVPLRSEEGSNRETSGLSAGPKARIALGCVVAAAFASTAALVYRKRWHRIRRSRPARTFYSRVECKENWE